MFHNISGSFLKLWIMIFLGGCLLIQPELLAKNISQGQPVAPPAGNNDTQSAINILEDDQKRAEMLNLLKQMAAAEGQGHQKSRVDTSEINPESVLSAGVKAYLREQVSSVWRNMSTLRVNLDNAWLSAQETFKALGQPQALSIWRPYALKIFIWGLICLLTTVAILKYTVVPKGYYSSSLSKSLKSLVKYILVVILPNAILILSLLIIPPLSTTMPGVTADLGAGFTFVHAVIQHLFINLLALCVSLKLGESLLLSGGDRQRPMFDFHPIIAEHIWRTWKWFSIYVAFYIFIDETILNSFAAAFLYSLSIVIMVMPIPIYLTVRLVKIKAIFRLASEAEASADSGEDASPADGEPPAGAGAARGKPVIEYRVDLFFKKYLPSILIATIWVLAIISLFNPLGLAGQFGYRIVFSILIPAAGIFLVRLSRRLIYERVSDDTEEGRWILLRSDGLINLVIWFISALLIICLWILPLESLSEKVIVRDIIARAFAIGVVVVLLIAFTRFSNVITAWLLSVPSLENNRSWRTITPLILSTAKALAIFVALVVILERLGVNVGPILAGAGILGLGVGMGAQSLVKDVINGLSILMMDTLSVGDWVTVGGYSGTVVRVGIRSISLRDSASNLIVVPNSNIDSIINMTRDYSQDLIDFIVPYDSDPDEMMKLATGVAAELSSDPAWEPYLAGPVSVVGITAFDAYGTTIRLKIHTTAGNQWKVGRELRLRIKRRMKKEGLVFKLTPALS